MKGAVIDRFACMVIDVSKVLSYSDIYLLSRYLYFAPSKGLLRGFKLDIGILLNTSWNSYVAIPSVI